MAVSTTHCPGYLGSRAPDCSWTCGVGPAVLVGAHCPWNRGVGPHCCPRMSGVGPAPVEQCLGRNCRKHVDGVHLTHLLRATMFMPCSSFLCVFATECGPVGERDAADIVSFAACAESPGRWRPRLPLWDVGLNARACVVLALSAACLSPKESPQLVQRIPSGGGPHT